MKAKLEVPPFGWVAKLADILMIPVMYVLSGTFKESPQCTHRWNNKKLSEKDLQFFDESLMLFAEKDLIAMRDHFVFLFHLPVFGGWKEYVVIEPLKKSEWHVGWKTGLVTGVSMIKLSGPVRVLRGPKDSLFFGVDAKTGEQIPLQEIGRGRIGCQGIFSRIRLL